MLESDADAAMDVAGRRLQPLLPPKKCIGLVKGTSIPIGGNEDKGFPVALGINKGPFHSDWQDVSHRFNLQTIQLQAAAPFGGSRL
jgi:hypothetical protein